MEPETIYSAKQVRHGKKISHVLELTLYDCARTPEIDLKIEDLLGSMASEVRWPCCFLVRYNTTIELNGTWKAAHLMASMEQCERGRGPVWDKMDPSVT